MFATAATTDLGLSVRTGTQKREAVASKEDEVRAVFVF